MSYTERKSDIEELRCRLQAACLKKDSEVCYRLVKKVIEYMTHGIDVSSLFHEMLNASAMHDIKQKKLIYLYICTHAESNSTSALLTINMLVKDALDHPNPLIRGLALRSMFNIRLANLVQYMKGALIKGLNDSSSYVKQNAVMASLKLFKISANTFQDLNLLEKLYDLIHDGNGQVSFNAICTVDEVLKDNGGIEWNTNLVNYILCERLSSYNEWNQCILLEKICRRYEPSTGDEVFEYLNCLDEKLVHTNKALVMSSINLFIHFTKSMENLKTDVFKTIKGPILSILQSSSAELQITILHHILVVLKMQPNLFNKEYKYFFIKFNEVSHIKYKKLEILLEVVTEGNVQNVINEITEYIHNSDIQLSYCSIKLIGSIAIRYPYGINVCLTPLIETLKCEVDYLTAYTLEALHEVVSRNKSIASLILPELQNCWELVQHHSNGKASLIWLYGEFGEAINTAPYKLEELINDIEHEHSSTVKLALLTSIVKLFFKRPPECHKAMKKYIQYCVDEEKNMVVRDKALFYLRLLQDMEKAKSIIDQGVENLEGGNQYPYTIIDRNDFRVKEFNSLSVLYNQPSSSFCHINKSRDIVNGEEIIPRTAIVEPQEVLVDTILNFTDDEPQTSNTMHQQPTQIVQFQHDFTMEKDEYQKLWKSLQSTNATSEIILKMSPSNEQVYHPLNENNMKVLAASPPTHSKRRYLIYSKMNEGGDSGAVILVELVFENNILITNVRSNQENTKNELLVTIHEYFKDFI